MKSLLPPTPEYKLYLYWLHGKYGYDIPIVENAYFLAATSMEDAVKKLNKVIDDGYQFYNVRECNVDELPEIFAKLPHSNRRKL
ncbi:hypothetical protein G5604_21845 [Escherichia coli]|uniref:hypothetical protein n=1 Tax=Escherichia coli TaxID=562 RepID=UPI0013D52040|nr:hypothetical protein [Escherichia coli]EKX8466738.1 hypothetical protein [Klebsiella pneumoniae]ELB7272986.1 hypothetical protein [Klebsiella pneumoniae]NGE86073.1 hypothetical protein [Escherichia coli]HCQ8372887.1 hypothetical protein [Klebsiella pneumoniae]